jgi:hypothetical protein
VTRLFSVNLDSGIRRLDLDPSTEEAAHLHRLIEANPELIPGDEIAPENPPQWLVIKSEMPIADPEDGQDRWSLDLLLADQRAWPALVECKLVRNAEIRREIIGQAIEYAANAQHYWDAEQLKKYALDRCGGKEQQLHEQLQAIGWTESVDEYFHTLVKNLHDGHFRLIFAVDNAPYRLRSTVEFLNRELETIEAVVVEVRRYKVGTELVVSSGVLGYTEQIRHAKRDAIVRQGGENYDEETFMSGLRKLLIPDLEEAARQVLDSARAHGWTIRFGSTGDLLLGAPFSGNKTVFGIHRQGNAAIEWYIGLHESSRERLASTLRSLAVATGAMATGAYPKSPAVGWIPKVNSIFDALDKLGPAPPIGSVDVIPGQ